MSHEGKKLINSPESCVDDCLEGLVAVNPGLQILDGHKVIIRADIENIRAAGKVTLVSGGGSGHEPFQAGYVGPGMLSAAVCGAIFTSPSPSSILAALRAVGSSHPGTLLTVANYTGDRLNFGIAAERAKTEGLKVEVLVVGEDCAMTSNDKSAGRRGLAGNIFIHKIAGHLAEEGKSLEEIVKIATQAVQAMGTIGLSLSPCSIPGSGPSFHLEANEMELGLGLHGEAGVRRVQMTTAKEAVSLMLDHMLNPTSSSCLHIPQGGHLAMMVNNLGGTSVLELNIVAKEAIHYLENRGLVVDLVYCGTFATSLEMAGVLLTIMILDDTLKVCLNAFTSAPGWTTPLLPKGHCVRTKPSKMPCQNVIGITQMESLGVRLDAESAKVLHKAISYACEALGNCERQLNSLDTQSGDGDCGTTIKRGTDAIRAALGDIENPGLPINTPHSFALSLAAIAEEAMGGSSGALYGLFLSAAASPLKTDVTPQGWISALCHGLQAIQRYGKAEPGDRTMVDALNAAHVTLAEKIQTTDPLMAYSAAVMAAEQAAIATAKMAAKAGRASYVSVEYLNQPDPGAHAVGIWMRASYEACKLLTSS